MDLFMNIILSDTSDLPTLRIKFIGNDVDRFGTNIHQLGRSLISSQELVNVTASYDIKRDIPLKKYQESSSERCRPRVFFLQGHLGAVHKGSLELFVQLVGQPELRSFLLNENVRAFGVSVLANMVTTASFVLAGRWRDMRDEKSTPGNPDTSLAVALVPSLEQLSRTVTPRGGIGHIEMIAEDQNGGRVELRVDRQSRENVLSFAEAAPAKDIDIVGEIRSIDLDSQIATINHAATGERIEVKFYENHPKIEGLLRQMVYVRGRVRPKINRRGGVQNRVEALSIKLLSEIH